VLRHRLWHTRTPWPGSLNTTTPVGASTKEMTLPTLSTLPWSWPAIFAALVVAALAATARRKDDDSNIPWATGAIPLLGHALAYKRDPATFITEQRKLVGDVFRLNLAGKRMIVIAGGAENVKAVAFASERRFSARAAVRDVGFGELLGERNVDAGTDFHARVLRRWRLDDAEIAELAVALDEGLDAELTGRKEVPDLLAAIRGAVLRAVLARLIGGGILERGGKELVDAIVQFQDGVEEATAAAAVLPRWLALPLILWPAARRRRRLEKRIAAALGGDGPPGPWTTAFGERGLPAAIAAEFSVGLLFAAHKNPAIASFQALLFLHERRLPAALHACVNTVDSFQEALVVAKNPSASTLREAQQLCRVALEAIRLTAHTVGAVRLATEDCALPGNRVVKKGETVALSHIAFSRDEALWGPDAAEFNTAREAYAGPVAFDSRGSADDIAYSAFSQGTPRRARGLGHRPDDARLVGGARRPPREGATALLRAGDARSAC
jgi:cytochrome P450